MWEEKQKAERNPECERKLKKLESQAKRGDKIDAKAREISKTAILIISIAIAIATLSVDMTSLIRDYIIETGFIINESGVVVFPRDLISILLSVILITVSAVLTISVVLFVSVPYYAIRAQNSSKLPLSLYGNPIGGLFHVIFLDCRKILKLLVGATQFGNKENNTKIICHETFDPDLHGNIDSVISDNQICIQNKHRNLTMAKSNFELYVMFLIISIVSSAYIFFIL